MDKKHIFKRLQEQYPTEPVKHLNEAAYNLAIAGVQEASLMTRAERALQKIRSNNQTALSKTPRVTAGPEVLCSVCRNPMLEVKLVEDRPAHYCPDHRTVEPIAVKPESA